MINESALDAYCIPCAFGEHLGFPPPSIREGHKGYEFTLVYDLPQRGFDDLVREVAERVGLSHVRTSICDTGRSVSRVGMGWGGVSLSANLQYMEALRRHGVEVVIGGEVDEYAMDEMFLATWDKRAVKKRCGLPHSARSCPPSA